LIAHFFHAGGKFGRIQSHFFGKTDVGGVGVVVVPFPRAVEEGVVKFPICCRAADFTGAAGGVGRTFGVGMAVDGEIVVNKKNVTVADLIFV
jgi:hypothetical protein